MPIESPLQFTRTRIAPTPSGYLHLGNVLSFAITAALAQQSGARILLRIDDMDRERVQDKYVQDIFDTLNFMEIPWDEGPRDLNEFKNEWSQMHRLDMYNEGLKQLRQQNMVFGCTCSRAQIRRNNPDEVYPGTCINKNLPLDGAETSWRLYTDNSEVSIKTLGGVVKTTLPPAIQNFVVRKKDGSPAYQLTSLLDDVHYGVDLVVRGEDLWASTIAQHYLAGILHKPEFSNTTFYHHPLLTGIDNLKLSKSAGATSVNYLRTNVYSSKDIWAEIGRMLGLRQPVTSMEQLVTAIALTNSIV